MTGGNFDRISDLTVGPNSAISPLTHILYDGDDDDDDDDDEEEEEEEDGHGDDDGDLKV